MTDCTDIPITPIAWVGFLNGNANDLAFESFDLIDSDEKLPLYTAPPQREWQGLTDEDVKELRDLLDGEWISYAGFASAIEAKLKAKNAP